MATSTLLRLAFVTLNMSFTTSYAFSHKVKLINVSEEHAGTALTRHLFTYIYLYLLSLRILSDATRTTFCWHMMVCRVRTYLPG